jgi:phosphatidyl-myo-inositol dimannoside synthase
VCVSRMVARKGQDVLVKALPHIQRSVPGAVLLLVGDGPHRAAVEKLVAERGLEHDVVLTGRVPWQETPAFYDAGDVFAMPTRTRLFGLEPEALGICYLEAAATGLPVVAGSSGGAPDAVLHGENGYVVDGRDVEQVAARCSELLTDRELAARFGARGRQWVAARWRWDDLALRLHRILAGEPLVDERL